MRICKINYMYIPVPLRLQGDFCVLEKSCKIPDDLNIFLSMIRQIASFSEGCNKINSCIWGANRKKHRFFLKRNMF